MNKPSRRNDDYLTLEGLLAGINVVRKHQHRPSISVEEFTMWLDDRPDDVNSNPKSASFFRGATFGRKLATLRHVSPEKAKALETLLDLSLRDEFARL
jgi:hypothetical protein